MIRLADYSTFNGRYTITRYTFLFLNQSMRAHRFNNNYHIIVIFFNMSSNFPILLKVYRVNIHFREFFHPKFSVILSSRMDCENASYIRKLTKLKCTCIKMAELYFQLFGRIKNTFQLNSRNVI